MTVRIRLPGTTTPGDADVYTSAGCAPVTWWNGSLGLRCALGVMHLIECDDPECAGCPVDAMRARWDAAKRQGATETED